MTIGVMEAVSLLISVGTVVFTVAVWVTRLNVLDKKVEKIENNGTEQAQLLKRDVEYIREKVDTLQDDFKQFKKDVNSQLQQFLMLLKDKS
jgi:seryl-tRNA synthetase